MARSSFRYPLVALGAVSLAWTLIVFAFAAGGADRRASANLHDPNPSVNAPDEFAWHTFIEVNKLADNGTNDTIWETWATDQDTFPPVPDPKAPPQWPGNKSRPKALVPSTQFGLLNKIRGITAPQILPNGGQEEVRRNKPAFDFIVNNDLWNLDGLTKAYTKRAPLVFPVDAIEIKAQWAPIDASQKARFHWNQDASGRLFGLIALHISTKALPNWFWATFEHVDNLNRGKDLGYHDSFGTVPPNSKDGLVSPALIDLLAKAGLGAEWQNYRLDGTQVDFLDATGDFTRMGNSVIEDGLVAKSSCMNCHAMARVNATAVGGFDFIVGIPDKSMFYFSDGTLQNLQLDFVWGFSHARPLPKTNPKP